MRRFLVAAPILLVACAALAGDPTPPTDEDQAFREAQDAFAKNDWVMTAVAANDFEQRYPQSRHVAQALYQCGCAYLMLQRRDDAVAAFTKLLQHSFDSSWSQMALQLHLDGPALIQLGDTLRGQARDKRSSALAQQAGRVYLNFAQRFPNDNRVKGEVVYKLADCAALAGQHKDFDTAMQQLAKADQGDWSKLAAFRLGDAAKFQKEMRALLDLSPGGNEEQVAFRTLADRFQSDLPQDLQLACDYYRGHCAETRQRLVIFKDICRDHLATPWAAEAAFFLAEHGYEQGKYREAQAVYHALAARFPTEPRAAQAKRFAAWLDRHDDDVQDLGRVLTDIFFKTDFRQGGFAAKVRAEADGLPAPILLEFAFQDGQIKLQAAMGDIGFSAGSFNNPDGPSAGWYYFHGDPTIQRIDNIAKIVAPTLHLQTYVNAVTQEITWNFNVNANNPNGRSYIDLDPALGPALAKSLAKKNHLHKEGDPERAVFHTESSSRNPTAGTRVTLHFGPANRLQKIVATSKNSSGKQITVTVDDIRFGAPIPDAAFAMPRPAGVEVRRLTEVNSMEVMSRLMGMIGPLSQKLAGDLAKK
jgi:TolA-binding protein